MNVSMYNGSTDTVGVEVDYKKILKGIAEGKWMDSIENLRSLLKDGRVDSYDALKIKLPSVTFSGTFSTRDENSLKEYSGLFCVDIDKLDDGTLKVLCQTFPNDPFIHAYFISPSNKGIKVLIKTSASSNNHLAAYYHIEKYFKDTYAQAIDKKCKDICRLCFVSYDPYIYINENSEVMDIAPEWIDSVNTVKKGFDDRPDKFKGHVISKDAGYVFKVCVHWTERHHQYEPGNRNNYIHVLSCNLNRAGVNVKDAEIMIYNEYPDLPIKEISATVKSAYKRTGEHNSVDVYTVEANDLPDHTEDLDMTTEEEVVFNDTLHLLEKKVKQNLVSKLIKNFGDAWLKMPEDRVSWVMNQAFLKYKEINGNDQLKTESATDSLLKAISEYKDNGGIPTDIPEFDEVLGGGLMPSNLYGFIGCGGTFKSILAHCIAANLAKEGGLALYLNGEMARLQLMDRVVNKELGIELIHGLKDKSITEANVPEIVAKLRDVLHDNFQIVDGSGWTQESIIQTVNDIESKIGKKVAIIVVDGLTQMEDTKKDEIKSAIFNSGELKEVAKKTNSAVIALVHTSGNISKHTRDTSKFVRGGSKMVNNMDAMICTSLIIDETSSNFDEGDILYRGGIMYVRLIDKRGSGMVISKIVQIHRPLKLEALHIDPMVMEVKTNQ